MKYHLKCTNCHTEFTKEGRKSYLLNKKYVIVYTACTSENIIIDGRLFQSAACNCFLQKIRCGTCLAKKGFFVEKACFLCTGKENNGDRRIFNLSKVVISVK